MNGLISGFLHEPPKYLSSQLCLLKVPGGSSYWENAVEKDPLGVGSRNRGHVGGMWLHVMLFPEHVPLALFASTTFEILSLLSDFRRLSFGLSE